MLILGLAMKRSSEEAGKEITSPSKKQNKRKADKLDSSVASNSPTRDLRIRGQMQLAEASIERRSQSLTVPSMAPYHQGVPHSLTGNGSIYTNSFLSAHGMSHHNPPASMNVPSLLGNLPVHRQPPQMPRSFPPPHRGPSADAESLAHFILAAQLSRGFAGNSMSHNEQLNLLGIANSIQQQQQRANNSSQALVDRLVYYHGPTTAHGISSINPAPVLPHSGGTTHNSPLGLPSTSSAPSEQLPASGQGSDSECLRLSLSTDRSNLSEYQCLIREQICLFAATQADIDSSAQGRNRPIVLQQVGIRCRHCASLPASRRSRGAVYYPAKLSGLYQAAQNMTLNHFTTSCQSMPQELREEILRLKQRKSYVLGGGKGYWARGGQIRNIIEIDDRLFFHDRVPEHLKSNTGRPDKTTTNDKRN